MATKNYNINNLSGDEYRSILNNVDGLGDAYTRANEELENLINSNKKYKEAMEEIAKVENELINLKNASGDTSAKENELNNLREKHKKVLQEIYSQSKKLTDEARKQADIERIKYELSQDINKELEKEHRWWEKQKEVRDLEIRKIREGLTYEQEKYRVLTKYGEKLGINTDKLKKGIEEIKKGFNDTKQAVSKFNEPWAQADQAAANYIKRIGGTKESMDKLRKSTIDFMDARKIGIKYNTSMEELIKLQGDYNASIGRSINLTDSQMEKFAAMKSLVGDQVMMDFSTKLENFGLNPDEVGERVGKMFNKAAKSGVAFEKFSKNVLDNIKLAQNYNFKNGVNGLISMAKKAAEIKLDMQQIANFANKVSTLEGAVQAGAQLSVLGGSFARNGNPLSMMYEGLNDMEALQDRMIRMFGDLGKWDYSKGQVDISVFNKQRIRAAAEATGMDYSSVMESINAKARRNIVSGKLGDRYSEDENFRELLLNKAQLDEQGNAFVTINGKRKDVNELSAADETFLRASNNSDSDNIAEIAVNTRGYKDMKEGFGKQGDVASASLNELSNIGKWVKGGFDWLGNTGLLKVIKAIDPVLGITNGLLTMINGGVLAIKAMMLFRGGGAGGTATGANAGGGAGGFGLGGKFGQKYNYTMHKNGMASVPGTKPTAGMKFMKGVGRFGGVGGAAAGLVGGAVDIGTSMAYQNKEKDGGYVAGKAIGRGLELAGTGAMIGSMFGPVGTLVGAGIGALGGAIWGGIESSREVKKEGLIRELTRSQSEGGYGAKINNPDAYSINELEEMKFGGGGISGILKAKMKENGDWMPGFKHGTSFVNGAGIVSGKGSTKSDDIVARLSEGEAVVSADANSRGDNNAIVKAMNAGNTINVMKVEENSNEKSSNFAGNVSDQIKIDPIDININGAINLSLNGQNIGTIDEKVLANSITQYVAKEINEKIIQISGQYRPSRENVNGQGTTYKWKT